MADAPPASTDYSQQSRTRNKAAAFVLEILQTALLTLVIFLVVRSLVQNFKVEGASMQPTFESGQFLLINKLLYWRLDNMPVSPLLPEPIRSRGYVFGGPHPGDVIVFQPPTDDQKDYIKRVIAVPGDEVRIVRGRVFVNGRAMDEPYITHTATYDYPPNGRALRVPPDEYFVLGDNRPNSQDSHVGWTVPGKNIIGKAWLSYWPPQTWGVVKDGPSFAS